ncbi:MAG: flagellar hook-associated protein FlgL [Gallionella sp.]|nr:flagellar hook-associated protein FlgL [Gallionella sp.]
MRVSSNTLFDSNVAAMNQQQARLQQTQQQLSTGRKLLTASDDPVAAARALEVTQSDAMNTQYASNRDAARHTLSLAESTLQSVTSLLQDVKTAAINAGNGTLNSSDRSSIATNLSGRLEELIGLANTTDGTGNYLFAGFQSKTQPFVDTAAGVGYFGDDGQRNVQVSASRQMPSSNSGADLFMRIKNGNGTFVTQAAVTNAGGGAISQGTVLDANALTGNAYSITFTSATTYDVTNNSTVPVSVVSAGNAYVSGQAISFGGMQFDIKGAPVSGDSFTVVPSGNESVFSTISNMISSLNAPIIGANLSNALSHGIGQVDRALDNVLTARSSLGLRMNEIDALQSAGEDLGLHFKQTLSQLQDVDYNQAISNLVRQQTNLQAAQQSFTKVVGLSLFDYM